MPTKKEKEQSTGEAIMEEVEKRTVQEQYSEEQIQEVQAALTEMEVREMERSFTQIEDVPFEPEPQINDKAIMVVEENRTMLAEGVYITPGMPFMEVMRIQTMITSYTGVKPVKAMDFQNKWFTCIGAIYAPFERETQRLIKSGPNAGDKETVKMRWKAPLFKMRDIDPSTGEHMVMSGGGGAAKEFVQRMQAAGFAGDWDSPVELCFSVESRSGVTETLDKTTGEVTATKEPRNLLRLAVRMPTT